MEERDLQNLGDAKDSPRNEVRSPKDDPVKNRSRRVMKDVFKAITNGTENGEKEKEDGCEQKSPAQEKAKPMRRRGNRPVDTARVVHNPHTPVPMEEKGRSFTKAIDIRQYKNNLEVNDPQQREKKLVKGLRDLVSKKKKRFHNEKYDLDLAFITDRIIAMVPTFICTRKIVKYIIFFFFFVTRVFLPRESKDCLEIQSRRWCRSSKSSIPKPTRSTTFVQRGTMTTQSLRTEFLSMDSLTTTLLLLT